MACAEPDCGGNEKLPFTCRRCGREFCSDHRLPENHDCSGLPGTHNARPATWFKDGEAAPETTNGRSTVRRYWWVVLLLLLVAAGAIVVEFPTLRPF